MNDWGYTSLDRKNTGQAKEECGLITIFEAKERDFSTMGLGALQPEFCHIEENAAGLYELTLRLPIREDNRAFGLMNDRIIKADVPVRETPRIVLGDMQRSGAVTREIWKVKTQGSRLHLRSKPNGHIIGAYPPGTRVVKYGESSVPGWWGVIVCEGGAKGYMYSQYLEYEGVQTEQVSGDTPGKVIEPRQTRQQLFRICSVTTDSEGRYVEARARHISYDMAGAVIAQACVLDHVPAAQACEMLCAAADHDTGFEIICAAAGEITGDFTGMSLLECLLDPETGIAAQTGAKVLRDNFTFYILPDEQRERGVEIRYGKNLTGAWMEKDSSDIVTRIIPVGKDEKGNDLIGEAVESAHIDDYPIVRTAFVRYGVKAGRDLPRAQALAVLKQMAQTDMDAGCDLIGMQADVSFLRLELAQEYAHLANEYALHLYDSVPVIDTGADIRVCMRMVGYVFDVLGKRYIETRLGDIGEVNGEIYGYELAPGAVTNAKIAKNAVDSANLRDLSVTSAKIGSAAVTSAKIALLAVDTANIADLAVTAAKIADAAITSAKIKNAAIGSAHIGEAAIQSAHIGDAQITGAKIAEAAIGSVHIEDASIDTAKIALGAVTRALIEQGAVGTAQIADGSITDAKIVKLTANKINAGTLSVERLIVVGGDKSIVYTINSANGTPQLSQTTIDGGALTERSITADRIAAGAITAEEIAAATIMANNIDVNDLFAADATILALDNYILRASTIQALKGSLDLWAQEKIDLAVGDIEIGGTNLIRETGWYDIVADPSAGWEGRDGFTLQPYNGGTDDFPDTGFVQWDSPASLIYLWSPDTNVKPGETYTVSLRYRGTGSLVWYGRDANWNQIWSADEYYTSDTITEFSATRTIPDNVVHLKIVCGAPSGTAGVLGCIKLERGNKATAWSPHPMDRVLASGSVVYGSDLNITKDRVIINTPELDINVSGLNGDAHFGAKGFSVDVVNSPSVLKQYTGPTTLTITQYANEVNGVDRFATLGDAFAKLSNCFLPYPVSITHGVPNLVEANAKLQNTCGAYIQIYGNSKTFTGQISFESVQSRIIISSLTVQNGSGDPMVVNDCTFVRAQSCTFISSADYMGMDIDRSTLDISGCSYRNCHAAVRAQHNSYVSIYNCSGNANVYSVIAKYNTRIGMLIKRPASTNGLNYDASCSVSEDPGSGESSGSTTPAATTTVTLTATNTRTHAGGWYSGTNVLSQGISGGTNFYGYMWFDLSQISGKTIKAATIRLYRRAGVGRGVPVDVYVGTHNASGPSGGLNMVNAYSDNLVGKVDQKETLTASITVAAVQELASGSAKGLFVHSGSSGYAQFDGYDGGTPPQLLVTYA